jgi:hypothetical protein
VASRDITHQTAAGFTTDSPASSIVLKSPTVAVPRASTNVVLAISDASNSREALAAESSPRHTRLLERCLVILCKMARRRHDRRQLCAHWLDFPGGPRFFREVGSRLLQVIQDIGNAHGRPPLDRGLAAQRLVDHEGLEAQRVNKELIG